MNKRLKKILRVLCICTIILLLLILLLAALRFTLWYIRFTDVKTPPSAPEHVSDKIEDPTEDLSDSIKDTEDLTEDSSNVEIFLQQQGDDAVILTYSKEVIIDLSEKTVQMFFANPEKYNKNMMLQIVIQDSVISQSGLITPGQQVIKLDLSKDIGLWRGLYEGKVVVDFYQPDSGEKEKVNAEFLVTITVVE